VIQNQESRAAPRFWLAPTAIFFVAMVFFSLLFERLPVLYDTDSYYHLSIARTYARHGIVDSLPWAQLSILRDFADKEFLFHALLAPLADTRRASAGGRLALAFLNALTLAFLAWLGQRAIGRWGLLTPLLVYIGSFDVLGRVIRLRPELLSLLLLLLALVCMGGRRHRTLGAVAFVYTLSYTAFHAFLGLCGLFFLHQIWARGRREWGLLLYPTVGVGLGLVLHPHFPRNLVVWKIQSIDFFQLKDSLPVGQEIGSHSVPEFLGVNLVWLLAMLALWRASVPKKGAMPPTVYREIEGDSGTRIVGSSVDEICRGGERGRDDLFADAFLVAAVAFGGLYLLMLRFSIYAVPFATLALLFELRRRGLRPGRLVALPWRGSLPLFLVLTMVLAAGAVRTARLLIALEVRDITIPREVEWAAFGQSLKPGARVAADWGATHLYMFWAPQATFLNVLDPIFMAVPFPQAYGALRAILEDREPDIPLALRRDLASDHLALSRYHQPGALIQRLEADPRLRPLHQGYTLLFQVVAAENSPFLLDWRVVPPGARLPPSPEGSTAWPLLRRQEQGELRALEAYVDASQETPAERRCTAFSHLVEVVAEQNVLYELAPYGPTRLWLDDRLAVAVEGTLEARLGRGLKVPAQWAPGKHVITVLTCRGQDASPEIGFYLRVLSPGAA
jgi:hypothetical protein